MPKKVTANDAIEFAKVAFDAYNEHMSQFSEWAIKRMISQGTLTEEGADQLRDVADLTWEGLPPQERTAWLKAALAFCEHARKFIN